MNELVRQLAELLAGALEAARIEGRIEGLQQALHVCDHLAKTGNWDHTLGAAECATRLRAMLEGLDPKSARRAT